MKRDKWQVTSDRTNSAASGTGSIRNLQFAIRNFAGFTLIELLIVISIIALLAAFTVPVMHQLKRTEYINKTKAEMAKLETAIDSYKATHGFYPPNNPANPGSPLINPLYFELLGTTNNNSVYYTLDGTANISAVSPPAATDIQKAFGVSGFINCTKGSGEDAVVAKNFLPDLSSRQIGQNVTNNGIPTTLLLASVGGPDATYKPLGVSGLNPWRYVCPGTNNPASYDLWVDLSIGGQTNLICNWTKEVQKNTTLP
jgi:prepilin-type N-terminal cleavage/methylation domain-containing protein